MKQILTVLILSAFFLNPIHSQDIDPKLSSKYSEMSVSSLSLVKYIDEFNFKPIKLVDDVKTLKALLLQMNDAFYKQVNISSWWMCSAKHEEYFEIYNLYYPKISKEHYAKYCKEVNALMMIDGVVEQPK